MIRLPALSAAARDTFWRSLQTLNGTRVVIALVLLVYLSFDSRGLRSTGDFLYAQTCASYLFLAVVFALTAAWWRHRFLLQLLSQVSCDLVVISLLYMAAGGVRSGLAILYLFPLAGCAILAPLVLALLFASLASLFMLGESLWRALGGEGDMAVLQAGLYGAAFFAAVLVVNRMAARLIGQEELAVQRGIEIGVQQAVNRLVMSQAGDGIVVVGPDGELLAGNPAARQMLGLSGALGLRLGAMPSLHPIAQAYEDWRAEPARHTAFVTIKPYTDPLLREMTAAWSARADLAAHLKVRFAAAETAEVGVERNVIFLQDVTAIENQAQQLKLASMGRLTASIAHEVRNPLSAIGHATSLLAEDLHGPVHVRLLKIVADNVARVNRMVEDILQLSRKAQGHAEPLALAHFAAELKAEFDETQRLDPRVLDIAKVADVTVHFDPVHLRAVLLNLLGNAIRYASRKGASIRLFVVQVEGRPPELHVQDDGPGITPEVRAHLFEPFYTTSSKGTGLGLYLARELCLNNDAMLDYEYRFDAGPVAGAESSGRFVITFARPYQ
ncbi:two-component system sensor histidine kinase PilS (NtrC family) [Pseudoduganella flava]|uniref:histidine kinase n=1 Tax=Pseudoduganella flava TaxID=871742 RepID=A0A562PW20_9BURK|nr:ATP-binding protein [Pseudoduganella flava]QGZ39699.1 PAS domain-containing protein [Pseudoduganella flava]TWI48609.1 two-component system sensor histidine kinase PilS (NtrC family) [Pseudoduganella flava]